MKFNNKAELINLGRIFESCASAQSHYDYQNKGCLKTFQAALFTA